VRGRVEDTEGNKHEYCHHIESFLGFLRPPSSFMCRYFTPRPYRYLEKGITLELWVMPRPGYRPYVHGQGNVTVLSDSATSAEYFRRI
jgi:hypothetical protein